MSDACPADCPLCDGTGRIPDWEAKELMAWRPCSCCRGTGTLYGEGFATPRFSERDAK